MDCLVVLLLDGNLISRIHGIVISWTSVPMLFMLFRCLSKFCFHLSIKKKIASKYVAMHLCEKLKELKAHNYCHKTEITNHTLKSLISD